MEFKEVIKKRQATRKFNDVKVDRTKLQNILEAGRLAPTAKNLEPVKIYIIESEEGLKKIDKATPCRYGANTVLLICGDTEIAYKKGGFSTYEMDSCIVATHIMLAATDEGLDNIWIELFDEDIIREEFNIPNNLKPVCLLPVGYRAIDCPNSPYHNIRKQIEELTEYL